MSGVIAVLTYKSADTILAAGGAESWTLDRRRAARCNYVLICRNANTRDAQGAEPHGAAFMVGKIKDIVPSLDSKGRWVILISEYARIDVPNQWSGRNPVRYWKESDFPKIDFRTLAFKPVRKMTSGLTIVQAKAGLALQLSVPESAIEIIVRA